MIVYAQSVSPTCNLLLLILFLCGPTNNNANFSKQILTMYEYNVIISCNSIVM